MDDDLGAGLFWDTSISDLKLGDGFMDGDLAFSGFLWGLVNFRLTVSDEARFWCPERRFKWDRN